MYYFHTFCGHHLPALVEQAANYFRLVGILVTEIGMLYVMSGRLNAEGFVLASLVDGPLVPIATGILWYMEMIPGLSGPDILGRRLRQFSLGTLRLARRVPIDGNILKVDRVRLPITQEKE